MDNDEFGMVVRKLDEYYVNLIERLKKIDGEIADGLRAIYTYHEKHKLYFQLARYTLGLARYLDFQLDTSKVQNQLQNLARISYQIIQIVANRCGQHEDGACLIANLSYGFESPVLQRMKWPTLPFAHALSFDSPIKPIVISQGAKIYRVIGKGGNEKGHWWLENKPSTKRNWRSDFAVLESWNAGEKCITVSTNEDINVWVGATAPQVVYPSNENCYLPGGEAQLYLDYDDSKFTKPQIYTWP